MEYVAKVYSALCSLSEFTINGIDADLDDFVDKYDDYGDNDDYNADEIEECGCYNMTGDVKEATVGVMLKYNINRDEYVIIAKDIADKVSFNRCNWCN